MPGHADMTEQSAENDALWSALVRQRKTMRMKQADVAAALGVGQQIVSRWESGHTEATLSTVAGYASAVGARVIFSVIGAEGVIRPEAD